MRSDAALATDAVRSRRHAWRFLARQYPDAHGEVVGCIDAGRVGIADRYQDIAILWNYLGEFGKALQDRLLEQYGIVGADERKLQFHLMLDEMF